VSDNRARARGREREREDFLRAYFSLAEFPDLNHGKFYVRSFHSSRLLFTERERSLSERSLHSNLFKIDEVENRLMDARFVPDSRLRPTARVFPIFINHPRELGTENIRADRDRDVPSLASPYFPLLLQRLLFLPFLPLPDLSSPSAAVVMAKVYSKCSRKVQTCRLATVYS